MAWKRPPSSALRRRTRAPAWASIAAPSRLVRPAHRLHRGLGRASAPDRSLCRAPAPGMAQAQRRDRRAGSRTVHRAQRSLPDDSGVRRPAPPIPTPRRPSAPRRWWPSACRRFRNGASPSRARAPAAAPWIGPTVEADVGSHRRVRRARRCCFSPSAFSAITSKFSTTWIFSSASLPPAESPPGAARVAECLGHSRQSGGGSGAAGAGAAQ